MPSFDVVSKTDIPEVDNAIQGALREISTRYDFKNSKSSIERENEELTLIGDDKYKIDQVQQILRTHLVRRKLDTGSFLFEKVEDGRGGLLKQLVKIKQGIDKEVSQKINKDIKAMKLKVQIEIRGDEMRVSGKKRDILQDTIQKIKNLNLSQPIQFINFRD
tara:strand:+ start:960 stop:1445 length:486 start_codon:yes stop_codon:yes gene_type:complete